jgi:SAM-dependent methyltransferase
VRREYFEAMYAANPDPWGFTTRWYERRKYALTLAALSRPRYRSVFEPGCSIGILTEALALRCDRLLSVDLVDAAVRQCRTRTATLPSAAGRVEVRQWDAAGDDWPDESFDLVVVSEILYYFDVEEAQRFVRTAVGHLTDDGEMVLVHWRPRVPEYPLSGDEAHAVARQVSGLEAAGHYEDADLILDRLHRPAAESVASREGLR